MPLLHIFGENMSHVSRPESGGAVKEEAYVISRTEVTGISEDAARPGFCHIHLVISSWSLFSCHSHREPTSDILAVKASSPVTLLALSLLYFS